MDKVVLNQKICDEVDERWKKTELPVLLSALGAKFSVNARDHARSLSSYIRSELGDKIAVIKHSDNATITAALPIASKPEGQEKIDELLSKLTSSSGEKKWHRFFPIFWNAFRKPIDSEYYRYVVFEDDRFRIREKKSSITAESDWLRISDKWIATDEKDLSDKEIYELITGWAAESKIELGKFAYQNNKVERYPSGPARRARTLLELLLSELSPRELERIKFPLDIINHLHNKKL